MYEEILDNESLPDLIEPPDQSDSESDSEEELSVINHGDDESIPELVPDLLSPSDFSQGDISSDDELRDSGEYRHKPAMKIDKLERGENQNHNNHNNNPALFPAYPALFPAYQDFFELYGQIMTDKVDQSSQFNAAPAEVLIDNTADDDTVWSFDAILDHQGPLRKRV